MIVICFYRDLLERKQEQANTYKQQLKEACGDNDYNTLKENVKTQIDEYREYVLLLYGIMNTCIYQFSYKLETDHKNYCYSNGMAGILNVFIEITLMVRYSWFTTHTKSL